MEPAKCSECWDKPLHAFHDTVERLLPGFERETLKGSLQTLFGATMEFMKLGCYRPADPTKKVQVQPSPHTLATVTVTGDSLGFLTSRAGKSQWERRQEALRHSKGIQVPGEVIFIPGAYAIIPVEA